MALPCPATHLHDKVRLSALGQARCEDRALLLEQVGPDVLAGVWDDGGQQLGGHGDEALHQGLVHAVGAAGKPVHIMCRVVMFLRCVHLNA